MTGLEPPTLLRVYRREAPVTVLGPFKRAALWVQGCSLGCRHCLVPDSWDPEGGREETVSALAEWILSYPDIEGITLSGGEPMMQAGALAELMDCVKSHRDLGVVCYTGYTLESLLLQRDPHRLALLRCVDLLVDGPYREGRSASLLWRGSDNQRLLPLSDRYRSVVSALTLENDRSAGLEFFFDASGVPWFAGIPPTPQFWQKFEERLRQRGVLLSMHVEEQDDEFIPQAQ